MNPEAQTQTVPVSGEVMPATTPEAQPVAAVPPETPKKSNLKMILVIGGAVTLLSLIGFLVYNLLFKGGGGGGSKETNLTWWGLWEDGAVVSGLISEYQAQNPKVKITYVKQAQKDYRERLTNALARGQGPDIFRLHNSWSPMFAGELDVMPATAMSSSEFASTFYPVAVADLTRGTGIVGVPLEYDGLALFINEDLFNAKGISVPTTWDDLRQAALALTEKDENGVIRVAGVALGRTENVDHWPEIVGLMMLQNGVNLADPQGTLAEAALKYYTVFSTVDGVWDETLPPATAAFAGGNLAMYFGPSWRIFEIKAQNPSLNFKVVAVPQLPKDSPSDPDVTYASYWVEGVWNGSQKKTEAWKFLKFLISREAQQKMYQAAVASGRAFGEPYARVDLRESLTADPLVGAYVLQAPAAKSWYLQSRTFDGPTGINSQINKYFEDAVNAVNAGGDEKRALATAAAGVAQVLSQYGIGARAQ